MSDETIPKPTDKIDDKEIDYLRKMYQETQLFMEKGLFVVSSAAIPLLLQFSKHLTDKTHTCKIFLYPSLFLAVTCFFASIITQLISFWLTLGFYEKLFNNTATKEEREYVKKWKLATLIIFIIGFIFAFFTIIFHFLEPFTRF